MLCIIFQLFQENDKKDEAEAEAALKKKADSDSEEEELDTQQKEKGISNKKKKVTLRHSNCFASFFFMFSFVDWHVCTSYMCMLSMLDVQFCFEIFNRIPWLKYFCCLIASTSNEDC